MLSSSPWERSFPFVRAEFLRLDQGTLPLNKPIVPYAGSVSVSTLRGWSCNSITLMRMSQVLRSLGNATMFARDSGAFRAKNKRLVALSADAGGPCSSSCAPASWEAGGFAQSSNSCVRATDAAPCMRLWDF